MTSKISCDAPATGGSSTVSSSSTNSNLTKFNSLNVTGITAMSGNSTNDNGTQMIKPLSNTTSADSPTPQLPTSYNASQNTIYSPLTPALSTVNPLSNNDVEDDGEIQSSNEQDEEIDVDETNEDDDDTDNERSRAREVFERVEERLRDSGINFDISNMLD
jgi:cyclophilin family peptidyl-prolyl cis-trans isomerase